MEMKKYNIGKMVEVLFDRVCDIKRYEFEIRNGMSVPVLKDIYNDVKCRISYSKSLANSETETVSEIKRHAKIFLPIEYKVICGDVFAVRKDGTEEIYKAAETPRIYTSHQETEAVLYRLNP